MTVRTGSIEASFAAASSFGMSSLRLNGSKLRLREAFVTRVSAMPSLAGTR